MDEPAVTSYYTPKASCVIEQCNSLPGDSSDKTESHRRFLYPATFEVESNVIQMRLFAFSLPAPTASLCNGILSGGSSR